MPADISEFASAIYDMGQFPSAARKWFFLCTRADLYNSAKMLAFMYRTLFRSMGDRYEKEHDMANKGKQDNNPLSETPWTFVNIQLTDEEIEAALEQLQDAEIVWEMLNECLEGGYKLSLTVEKESGSFCASLTGKFCPPANRDKTISGWHETALDSLRVLLYKHNVKLGGVWSVPAGAQARRG